MLKVTLIKFYMSFRTIIAIYDWIKNIIWSSKRFNIFIWQTFALLLCKLAKIVNNFASHHLIFKATFTKGNRLKQTVEVSHFLSYFYHLKLVCYLLQFFSQGPFMLLSFLHGNLRLPVEILSINEITGICFFLF